jgi:hypothetical protein
VKKTVFIIIIVIYCIPLNAQINFLGKSHKTIKDFFKNDPNFIEKIDTLSQENILLTFKSVNQYPYYTYIMDIKQDSCISFGLVAKNKDILNVYLDFLDFAGELIKEDTIAHNKLYEVIASGRTRYYDIKQPFVNDPNPNRKNLFYILVREKIRPVITHR